MCPRSAAQVLLYVQGAYHLPVLVSPSMPASAPPFASPASQRQRPQSQTSVCMPTYAYASQ